jgi:hypothetical protein
MKKMKRYLILTVPFLFITSAVAAQQPPSGKTLASTLEVYAFPQKGQAADLQSKDEASCYEWAVQKSGSDPFELQKQSVSQAEKTKEAKSSAQDSRAGSGLRGGLRGAAVGAIIGEIANDDAGKGAAYGAAAGAVGGRIRSNRSATRAADQAEQQGRTGQQNSGKQIENFKKAFSVCLEGKGYLVKY